MTLSVCIITYNEEANIGRTLASVQELVRTLGGEIIVVDSGSTDRTREIAQSYGAKVFVEEWKGFAAQKNSAIEKAAGEWVLLLDADEEIDLEMEAHISSFLFVRGKTFASPSIQWMMIIAGLLHGWFRKNEGTGIGIELKKRDIDGVFLARKNLFLGRWIRHGGFWPDQKLRLFRRGKGRVEDRQVHETVLVNGLTAAFRGPIYRGHLIHHAYPTLEIYLEHMRRYADLGAEMIRHKPPAILLLNRWLNPPLTFLYNYVFRLGFLDGREGFLLHWNHSRYVSWKYAKALDLSRKPS